MQLCRNCGSAEIYEGEINSKFRFWLETTWYFKLKICAECGLSDWFLRELDRDWVKKNFSPVNPAGKTPPNP
jgi:hypothetical protein